jgi:hypothetical protein
MSCIINSGYALDCRDNIGGVQAVYIRTYSASTTYSYNASGVITGSTSPTGGTFYKIAQRQETAEFIPGAGQHSLENGTNFWEQTVNLSFTKYQASLRDLVYNLALAEVEIIVLTQNGNYFLVGEQNGANLTASNLGVGKAFGDMNGATATFTAKEPKPAVEMSSTFFNSLTIV